MLKNDEIRDKYLFFRKGLNDFEAEWITCGCIYKIRKREWKDYCDFVDIEYQKLISHSVTRWTLFKTVRHLNHFWSLLMSKFRILRSPNLHLLRFYCVSPPLRQGFNRDSQMYLSSQVKSALRKLRDWEKSRIVTVHYSCQMYLYCTSLVLHIWLNGPLYLLNLNALTRFLRLQTTAWENVEPCD